MYVISNETYGMLHLALNKLVKEDHRDTRWGIATAILNDMLPERLVFVKLPPEGQELGLTQSLPRPAVEAPSRALRRPGETL